MVLKRAQYFLTCSGRMLEGLRVREDGILSHLAALERPALAQVQPEQLSLFGRGGGLMSWQQVCFDYDGSLSRLSHLCV